MNLLLPERVNSKRAESISLAIFKLSLVILSSAEYNSLQLIWKKLIWKKKERWSTFYHLNDIQA